MIKTLSVCAVFNACHLMLVGCSDSRNPIPSSSRNIPAAVSTAPVPDGVPAPNSNLLVLGEIRLNFIDLPEVTEIEAQELNQALVALGRPERTSIRAMPAFRAAEAKTSIGLYFAVMTVYPDLSRIPYLNNQRREEIRREWEANPDHPLTYTTTAEDMAFAERLSQITGRRFTVMTDSQNEYSIRGRMTDASGRPTGPITTSTYHFGEGDDQVQNHAFISTNPRTLDRAHGVHEIPEGADAALYKNSFSLIHPIGNVWSRSSEGVVRGGTFGSSGWSAMSSLTFGSYEDLRLGGVGSRLAEDPLP